MENYLFMVQFYPITGGIGIYQCVNPYDIQKKEHFYEYVNARDYYHNSIVLTFDVYNFVAPQEYEIRTMCYEAIGVGQHDF